MPPISSVAPVVIAIVGNPVTSGTPNVSSFDVRPEPDGKPLVSSTTTGMVTARISGGCTVGPNRFRRRTRHTAPTHPRKYAPSKTLPRSPDVCMSTNAPRIDKPSASTTTAHQGHPVAAPNADRRPHSLSALAPARGSLRRSWVAVTMSPRYPGTTRWPTVSSSMRSSQISTVCPHRSQFVCMLASRAARWRDRCVIHPIWFVRLPLPV